MFSLYCNKETVSGNVKLILQHRDSVGECYTYTATQRQCQECHTATQCRGMLSLYCNTETVSGNAVQQHRNSVTQCYTATQRQFQGMFHCCEESNGRRNHWQERGDCGTGLKVQVLKRILGRQRKMKSSEVYTRQRYFGTLNPKTLTRPLILTPCQPHKVTSGRTNKQTN